jgi:hypothetical protein
MRKPIVIPNGVRDLTQTHGSRNQLKALVAPIGKFLGRRGEPRGDIALFFIARGYVGV